MELTRLGTDEHGTWLGTPADSIMQRGGEPPITFHSAYVLLIPEPAAWWTMNRNAPPASTEFYADITTPPVWTAPDAVEMVDLDLDVIRRFDGETKIVDEDEFAEHQVRYGYPPEVIEAAEQSAAWLLDAVVRRAEPFGEVGRRWLAQVADR
jgi:hypothetical protein